MGSERPLFGFTSFAAQGITGTRGPVLGADYNVTLVTIDTALHG